MLPEKVIKQMENVCQFFCSQLVSRKMCVWSTINYSLSTGHNMTLRKNVASFKSATIVTILYFHSQSFFLSTFPKINCESHELCSGSVSFFFSPFLRSKITLIVPLWSTGQWWLGFGTVTKLTSKINELSLQFPIFVLFWNRREKERGDIGVPIFMSQ